MSEGVDRFGPLAEAYQAFRPGYPPALFAWLAEGAPGQSLAWDAGTGNGQAARGLANHFARVWATDLSPRQLAQASPHKGVVYREGGAEASGLPPASADLVTVAQALHWFPLEAFFREAARVLRPGGLLAAWTYGLMEVSPEVDTVVEALYRRLGPYWDYSRRLVEEDYASVSFPGQLVEAPAFAMEARWTRAHLAGYLRSWSAVGAFREAEGSDPVPERALAEAWGAGGARRVRWPLTLHVRRLR